MPGYLERKPAQFVKVGVNSANGNDLSRLTTIGIATFELNGLFSA